MHQLRLSVAAKALFLLLVGGTVLSAAPSVSAGGMMTPGKTGDLNGDGVANSLDALAVLFYDAGMAMPEADEMNAWTIQADVDCDLQVTSLDAAIILQANAGLYELRT
jgi:hypothetical protein